MIDKARVEDLLHECQRMSRVDADLVLDVETEALPILTDYRALRGIVEALAAIPPFYIDPYQDRRCAICEAKIGIDEHAELCAYRSAVALVGPAGEREERE